MTFVPPVLHAPTPELRRAALTALWPHGVRWGLGSISLERDLDLIKTSHARYISWLPRFKCLDVYGHQPPAGTLVNSPAHLLSYLRRHGQLTKS